MFPCRLELGFSKFLCSKFFLKIEFKNELGTREQILNFKNAPLGTCVSWGGRPGAAVSKHPKAGVKQINFGFTTSSRRGRVALTTPACWGLRPPPLLVSRRPN